MSSRVKLVRIVMRSVMCVVWLAMFVGHPAISQDLKNPPSLEIFAQTPAIYAPVISPDGSKAIFLSRKGTQTFLSVLELENRARSDTPLTGPERAATALKALDSNQVLISYLSHGSVGEAVRLFDLTTRRITATDTDFAPQSHPEILKSGDGRVLGQASYDDWVSYRFDDPEITNLPSLAARAFDPRRFRFIDFAADPRRSVILVEGDDDVGTYYVVDFAQDGFIELGKTRPALREEWITEKTVFSYRGVDGLEMKAYVTFPPGREPSGLPLIVLIQDDLSVRRDLGFDPFAAALATRGYAVLQPDLRGTDGYGDAFSIAGDGEQGRKALLDLTRAIDYLRTNAVIDGKSVCIVGSGFGGYVALASATFVPQQYRCAVDIAGYSDLKAYGDSLKPDAAALFTKRFGPESGWAERSPLSSAGNATASFLIVHPKDEARVAASQSRLMARALRDAGREVSLAEPGTLSDPTGSRIREMKLVIDFLLKANAPYRSQP